MDETQDAIGIDDRMASHSTSTRKGLQHNTVCATLTPNTQKMSKAEFDQAAAEVQSLPDPEFNCRY